MENAVFRVLFLMAILFLYVTLGADLALIVLLSLIYFKMGQKDE